ncbi:MAG: site-specific DNA-methyltransferase [Rhodospirillales bacterium]|nr:site-specific DNA-methyltransferase [Rhodospirillales bacterium]
MDEYYSTELGTAYRGTIEAFLKSSHTDRIRGKFDLIFTSPPFPLVLKKKYGNQTGEEYLKWLVAVISQLSKLLQKDGSLVIEIGNAWLKGSPVMSTLSLETLLAISKETNLHLCQQFICHNPARLPGPAQWVTIERIRVKDSFTHVWWFSPSKRPKACNRKVLQPYGKSMQRLMAAKRYNAGPRPSGHNISEESFFVDNGGAIPPNVLQFSNTSSKAAYTKWCKKHDVSPHPARMAQGLVEFFTSFLTDEGDLVLDPFAGSNTTGATAEKMQRRWIAIESNEPYLLGSMGQFDDPECLLSNCAHAQSHAAE